MNLTKSASPRFLQQLFELNKNRGDRHWDHFQREYWSEIAFLYDSLYQDPWSQWENSILSDHISRLVLSKNPSILDLGCGTGLASQICHHIAPGGSYTGVDISENMLDVYQRKMPHHSVHLASMSNLTALQTEAFDIILVTFTAFSFCEDPRATFAEISRLLRKDGSALISVINRFSLRRILKCRFAANQERYRTRRLRSDHFVPAHLFTQKSIRGIAIESGLRPIAAHGVSVLSGVAEFPMLLKINKILTKAFPGFSHELLLEVKKSDLPL